METTYPKTNSADAPATVAALRAAEPGSDGTLPRPPRWKMTLVATAAVYPISLASEIFLLPHLSGLPTPARDAVIAATFSTLMTYVTLPALTRLLRRWLAMPRRRRS